jgi:hypothetical protein
VIIGPIKAKTCPRFRPIQATHGLAARQKAGADRVNTVSVHNAQHLSPSLKHGLRAPAVAGNEFEPFVDWIVGPNVIEQLIALGLAEQGDSNRPSVGRIGYRPTQAGWSSAAAFWGHSGRRRRQLVA